MMLLRRNDGFTMIELLVAMAVFSFMLLIIVVGFINVVRLHNQALASNVAQDNARNAMDELVRAVRNSTGVVTPVYGTPADTLCLASSTGPQQVFYVSPLPPANDAVLYRADGCTTKDNRKALTTASVKVANFLSTVNTDGSNIVKPEVELTLTVASNNNSTNPSSSGAAIACGPTNSDRTFCSAITLTSGAVPR